MALPDPPIPKIGVVKAFVPLFLGLVSQGRTMVSGREYDAAANPRMNTASRGSRLSNFVQHNLGTVARKIDRHDQCGAHPFMEDAIVAARLICQMDQSPWLYVVSELKIARSKMPAAGVYSEESKIPSVESCEVGIDNVVKILQAVRHEV